MNRRDMFWIRGRKLWNAKPPVAEPTRDNWAGGVTLVVHHTAGIRPKRNVEAEYAEMRSIQRQHQDSNGWNDVGYNYVIMPSGRVLEGRGFGVRGAHTLNHNTQTIGVSFAGNYDVYKPSLLALAAFHLLKARLRLKGARILRVRGHRQMPDQSTACPGRHLMEALGL